MANQETFTPKDKVQILFHEYDTLRTEAIHRINNGYQLIAGSVALLIWLASKWETSSFCVLLIFSLFAVVFFWWRIVRDLTRLNRWLRELEKEINDLAGEQLLKWETLGSPVATSCLWGIAHRRCP
jgi:hypothetical protein